MPPLNNVSGHCGRSPSSTGMDFMPMGRNKKVNILHFEYIIKSFTSFDIVFFVLVGVDSVVD
jgi:hypothetical protein